MEETVNNTDCMCSNSIDDKEYAYTEYKLRESKNNMINEYFKSILSYFNAIEPDNKAYARARNEILKYAPIDNEYRQLYIGLLSMIYHLNSSKISAGNLQHILKTIDTALRPDKLLTPLTFADYEWEYNQDPDHKSAQNNRLSHIFKYPDNTIKSIYAFKLYTTHKIYIDDYLKTKILALAPNNNKYPHMSLVVCYNYNDNKWKVLSPTQTLKLNKPIYETVSYDLDVIELVDRNDRNNDFFCFITTTKHIPDDFYNDYFLEFKDDSDFKEEIKFLEDNNIIEKLNNTTESVDRQITVYTI